MMVLFAVSRLHPQRGEKVFAFSAFKSAGKTELFI